MAPYEAHDLSTNEKSHIPDEVLAQIPAHIFIAKFRDEDGDNIKTTIMPREIWTLHRRPEVSSAVRAVHLDNFFRLPPWGTDYLRAHELMSSIQHDGKAMITDNDGEKVEVLITKDIINEVLHFIPGAYDLIPKTKSIDNEKAFLKVKDSKFKYSDLIYTELELPLRLISQHLRVQKPPRYTEPFLHMAVVMALCVAEKRQVRCDFAKYILESLIEANLKNSAKIKLYMNAGPMLTKIAYQALGMIEDLPAASSQASLIQQAKYVPKAVRTTSSATSSKASKTTRSKKSSSKEEQTEIDKEQDSQESAQEEVPKEVGPSVPSEYESNEEDTSIPLERKSQRPRSQEQVLLDKAMARVEARRKELADARAAKAAGKTRPMMMEEARKIRIERAKALQKEKRRIEAEQKAQEEADVAKAAPTQETEVVDLSGTMEYLKRLEREKHTAEQRAVQLAQEKIKEALSRKAEEPILEPTQGSPKRPRQEEEEDIEDIQADPIPSSPISIPPAPQSSPITPFPPASTPQTPPSPSPLDIPLSPPAPISPQQQHLSAETAEPTAHITKETSQPMEASPKKETAQPMHKADEEKQLEGEQHQPKKVDVPILLVQDEEPNNDDAMEQVKNFDYTELFQTLTRQFQCQQVVAKETEIQRTRANQAKEEMANLGTALELVTKERDSSARENENLIRDLMDLQSQLTRKEAQNHELIKNEKKMKEQLKYEDAKYQKLNTSYNTVKSTLTALLQNQEPAAAEPSTSDSAALNTLAALQAELNTKKLKRQLLVSGFMSQTTQHEAKVKQLNEELAKAKADLTAVGSLASTSQFQQAETHEPIQPPQLPEMLEFQGIEEEEQQRPAPGVLDIREEIEQELEDLPEGPAKEYLLYEKKVMQSAALSFLEPGEQVKDFGTDFLPIPLMRHEAILWKEKMRPAVQRNEDGGYEGISLTTEEAKTLIKDHPRWRRKWLSERPRDLTNFHNTPQSLQIDPTYCLVPRQQTWVEFQKWRGKNKALLNYPVLSAQEPPTMNYKVNTLNTTIQLLREVPDISFQMLVKIAKMIVICIQVFKDTKDDDHPWNLFLEGRRGICWNLRDSPPRWIIMALYSRLMYLPSHYLQTFEEVFVTGFFEISTQIFHPMAKDLKAKYVAYLNTLAENPFRQQQEDIAFATRKRSFLAQDFPEVAVTEAEDVPTVMDTKIALADVHVVLTADDVKAGSRGSPTWPAAASCAAGLALSQCLLQCSGPQTAGLHLRGHLSSRAGTSPPTSPCAQIGLPRDSRLRTLLRPKPRPTSPRGSSVCKSTSCTDMTSMARLKVAAREKAAENVARPSREKGAKNVARPLRARDQKKLEKTQKVMEASVTINVGGGDVDVALLTCMQEFLEKETLASICSVERGGTLLYLHLQMVIQMWFTSLVSP
ncbi:hypothetical protein L7F22_012097 [Adiantum nelumboides]|nr:hypothetical protein [Adiantum nelumboides]